MLWRQFGAAIDWGRPSFRIRGKIFATLWPAEQRAMLKLPLAEQAALLPEEEAS